MNPNYKNTIKKIAENHGISVEEAEREMQATVEYVYMSPDFYARCIPSQDFSPTPEEVIDYVLSREEILENE